VARGTGSASVDGSRRQPSHRCAGRRHGHVPNRASAWSDQIGIHIARNVALLHGGAWSARVATIGHTSACRAIHASAPSCVRPVVAHRPAGLVSHGVPDVVSIRSGGRSRRCRAAWRVHRIVVVLRTSSSGEGSCRLRVSVGRFAANGGVSHVPSCRASATGHGDAPLGGLFESPGFCRAFSQTIAHSSDRPTRKWSRRARPTCAILSPRRAAHLHR
jgi:hypothetical protein